MLEVTSPFTPTPRTRIISAVAYAVLAAMVGVLLAGGTPKMHDRPAGPAAESGASVVAEYTIDSLTAHRFLVEQAGADE